MEGRAKGVRDRGRRGKDDESRGWDGAGWAQRWANGGSEREGRPREIQRKREREK